MRQLTSGERSRLQTARWFPSLGPYAAFAERWTIEVDDPALHALIGASFTDLEVDASTPVTDPSEDAVGVRLRLLTAGTDEGLLASDDQYLGAARNGTQAFAQLVWAINRLVLDATARKAHLLHAGGAARSDGAAVLLPAPSGSGKSTLTLALLERGLDYLSDEAVALDDDGRLHGYAKPVSIDAGAFPLFSRWRPADEAAQIQIAQWQVPASTVTQVAPSARLQLVVFPSYQPGARTHLEQLSPGLAAIEAAACSFADPASAHVSAEQVRRLATTVGTTPSYRLVMSELEAASELVLTQLDRTPRSSGP